MPQADRRNFLKLGAGGLTGAALWTSMIERAMAIAPAGTGSLADIDHIVIHMQENRSFDHYFGALNGVRGLGDPRPVRLPGGHSIWAQPSSQHPDGFVLPYHGDSRTTRSFTVDGADQSHQEAIHMVNRGRYDRWGHSNELHNRMLYYGPGDLPFYYALADAFTICDAYHCSTLTQTYPNRLHLFTGCNGGGTVGGDPEMSNYGEDETPSADMTADKALRADAYRWTTYAERLQQAGVSWKVYQEYDNFGDNLLSVFPPFRPCDPASELYRRGRTWVSEHKQGPDRTRSDGTQLVEAFRSDIAAGTLPQVSWIVTAADLSEHPTAEPAKGEHVTAKLIEALIDHPEVFARTAFILTYDEAGGFFDHMPPPLPPVGDYRGHSTVSVAGETKDWADSADWAREHGAQHPIGLGIRVPTIMVSPWSRGGRVCSELFDHTSVIRLMEQRFGVAEPNISPWRRAVCGDLTSAFDFASGTRGPGRTAFPDTSAFAARVARSKAGTAIAIPTSQRPAVQMAGQRALCPLPYRFAVQGTADPKRGLSLLMENTGPIGAVFTVRDALRDAEPWHFTIGAGDKYVHDEWSDAVRVGRYDLVLHGPSGFLRRFAGAPGDMGDIVLTERPRQQAVEVELINRGADAATFHIAHAAAYRTGTGGDTQITVPPGARVSRIIPLAASDLWYDFTVTLAGNAAFARRCAGKVETGQISRTDPGIGAMTLAV